MTKSYSNISKRLPIDVVKSLVLNCPVCDTFIALQVIPINKQSDKLVFDNMVLVRKRSDGSWTYSRDYTPLICNYCNFTFDKLPNHTHRYRIDLKYVLHLIKQ